MKLSDRIISLKRAYDESGLKGMYEMVSENPEYWEPATDLLQVYVDSRVSGPGCVLSINWMDALEEAERADQVGD